MNMISTGTFQTEMDASNKQPTLAEKFAAVWEKKNAKAARAGGVSLMALSLAACGSSDDAADTAATDTTDTTTTTTPTAPVVDASKEILLTSAQNIGASYTGGSGDDVFSGVIVGANDTGTTFQAGDVLTGGDGADTLTVAISGSGGGALTIIGVDTNSIEKFTLTNFDTHTGATTIDTTLMDGLTTVGLSSSSATGDTVFSGMTSMTAAQMQSGSADLTMTYAAATVAGAADVQSLALANVTAGTFTANSVETLNISTSLAKSTLTDIAGDALTGITVTGDQNLTVSAALTTKSIDASAMSGALTVEMGVQATQTVKGGSGNDVIESGTQLGATDVVDGGAGTDTLKISAAGTIDATAVTGELVGVSNIETIELNSTNDAATLSMTGVSGVDTLSTAATRAIVFDAGANDTANATDSAVIGFSLNGTAYTTAAQDASATAGEAATLIVAAIDALAGFSAVTNGNAGALVTGDTGEVVQFSLTSGYTNQDSSAYTDVTLSNLAGTEAVDIYAADLVTVTLKDASGSSDAMTINLKTDAADKALAETIGDINLTNVETLNLNTSGMKVETAKTLSALSGDALLTSLTITGDSDLVITNHGTDNTKLATIDASAMTGSLTLSDSVATLAQTITTGSGNDSVTMAGNLTAADVIDLGGNTTTVAGVAGTDSLTADLAAAGTSQVAETRSLSNIETVAFKLTTGNSFLDASKMVNVGQLNLWNADNDTTGVTISNLAAGTDLALGATTNQESNGTITVSLADETGTSDSLKVVIGDAGADDDVNATLKTTGIETITFARTATDADNANINVAAAKAATINLTGATTAAAVTTLGTLSTSTTKVDASAAPGLLSVTASATGTEIITKVGSASNTIVGGAGNDTITLGTLGGDDANGGAGTGTGDTLNATIKASTTEATTGFEIVNYTVGDNIQATITAANGKGVDLATTFNLKGGDALTTFAIDYDSPASLTTINMADYTGKSTSSTFAASQLVNTMTITGGAGKDTVIATTNNDNAAVKSMTGVETLELNAAGGATAFDFAKTSGITLVKTDDDGTARDITLTDLTDGTAIEVETGVTASGVIVDMANKAAAGNTLSMEIEAVAAAAHVIDIDIDEVETTTIKIDTATTLDLAGLSMTTGTSVLNLTGDSNVIVSALHQDVTTVDASGMSNGGSVTQNARSSTAAVAYTGSDGDDTFIMMNKGDVIDGSTGLNDVLDVNFAGILGGIDVDLTSTTDQVGTMDGAANAAVQKGFEDVDLGGYSGFGASILGTDAANEITGTASQDSISAGKGDDKISVAASGGGDTDIIDGGAGDDTLQLTGAAHDFATDTSLVNVENITLVGVSSVDVSEQTEAFAVTAVASSANTLTLGTTGLVTVTTFSVNEDFLNFDSIAGVAGNGVATAANATQVNAVDGAIYVHADGDDGTGADAAATQIADYTDLTDVAAFLSASYTTGNNEKNVFVINDLVGKDVYAYYHAGSATNATAVDAAEITLVAVLNNIGNTALDIVEIS